jgi:hypothetical protein
MSGKDLMNTFNDRTNQRLIVMGNVFEEEPTDIQKAWQKVMSLAYAKGYQDGRKHERQTPKA